jgi:uncharacterized iron-regulated membrane protein
MKRWVLRLHRWSGLLIAVIVVIVGGTGALTTYQSEFDAWLNGDLLRVEPSVSQIERTRAGNAQPADPLAALPLDQIVTLAEAVASGLYASSVRLPQTRRESIEVSVARTGTQDFAGWYVYVDPYRGHVLGQRPFDPDPWSRRGIVASLYEVHYSLAASRPGVWLVSGVATVWLVTSMLGLVLAWPRSWADLRRAFRVRVSSGAVQFNRQVHRLTGLLAAPFLIVVLATGIALNLSAQATGLLERFSPLTFEPALTQRAMKAAVAPTGWQAAADVAQSVQPNAQAYSLYLDLQRGVYVVRMREPGAVHRRGQTRVYVDALEPRVLAVWNPRAGSAGDRVWGWQNPLHSGHAFGAPGRVIVFVSGLAALLFVLTGVPLWFARRPAQPLISGGGVR